jgi:hypothetical protein
MKNMFGTGLRWVALGWLSAVCLSGMAQVAQGTLKEVVVTASNGAQLKMGIAGAGNGANIDATAPISPHTAEVENIVVKPNAGTTNALR